MRCLADFLVGGVRVAPTQVLGDGAAKQHVFLQHHGDLVTQRVQVVVAHVHAAHAHSAFGGVVQAGDEVNERGLGRAGAADDADGLAARNVQVDIVERLALRMLGILKTHVVKVDGTVGNLEHGLGGIGDRGSAASTSAMRCADSSAMVTMTKIIDSCIRLMRIWKP